MQNSPTTSTSKRKLAVFLLLPALIFISAGFFTFVKAPQVAQDAVQSAIENLGFSAAQLPQPSKTGLGTLTYNDLKLDTEGFSTIKSLTIHYDPLSLWLIPNFKHIEIAGLRLIGELEDNAHITLAGHNRVTNVSPVAFKDLTIKDGQITLQSQQHGIITVNFDTQAKQDEKGVEAQYTLGLTHNALRLSGKGNAHLSNNWWTSTIEIQTANLDHPDLKMTRASGSANIQSQAEQPLMFETELRSDGLKFIDQNWKNASLSLRGTPNQIEMLLGAKTISAPNIELSLSMPSIADKKSYSGTLFAPSYDVLKTFLQANTAPSIPDTLLDQLAPQNQITVNFEKSENDLISSLKDGQDYIDIKIEYDSDGTPNFGVIRPEEFSLFTPSSPIKFTGQYSRSTPLHENNTQEKISIKNSRIEIGDIVLTIPQSASLQAPCYPANLLIEADCIATISAQDNTPSFDNLKVGIANGSLTLNREDIKEKHFKTTVQDIEIFELLKMLRLNNWEGHGKLDGHFIVQNFQDTQIFTYAQLHNDQNGILKIKDPSFLSLIKTGEEEFELIQLALQDFHYDSLKIEIERTSKKELEIKINATGKNPALMRGRKFSMSFDFKMPSALFRDALWQKEEVVLFAD